MSRAKRVVYFVAVILSLGVLVVEAGVGVARPNARVTGFELDVSSLEQSEAFFTDVLDFRPDEPRGEAANGRRLRLGDETLTLRQRPSVAVPIVSARANDASFQHLAIVVSDMDAAFARLTRAGAEVVSAGPQRLPDWNRAAAGIRAVYFRDPDGHFLELIQYPPDKGEPRWHRQRDPPLFLGIDHSAVASTDTAASVSYYVDDLGLRVAGDSLNYGVEQERLSGIPGARVRITALRGVEGPGVELLEYLSPPGDGGAAAHGSDYQIDIATSRAVAERIASDPDGHAARLAFAPAVAWGLPLARRTFADHWDLYLMEAAELGIFMAVAVWAVVVLEHPASPVRRCIASAFRRRLLMGAAIGVTVVILIKCPWGFKSGAHFNPAVTLAFFRLGKIGGWDAAFYVVFQFLGGHAGVVLASLPYWRAARHPDVGFVVTTPGKRGVAAAFVAEFVISIVLFAALLALGGQPQLKPYVAWAAGALLFVYIVFEAPLSGMSLNPARSVASAVPAGKWTAIWVYFLAPPAAMLLAARLVGR